MSVKKITFSPQNFHFRIEWMTLVLFPPSNSSLSLTNSFWKHSHFATLCKIVMLFQIVLDFIFFVHPHSWVCRKRDWRNRIVEVTFDCSSPPLPDPPSIKRQEFGGKIHQQTWQPTVCRRSIRKYDNWQFVTFLSEICEICHFKGCKEHGANLESCPWWNSTSSQKLGRHASRRVRLVWTNLGRVSFGSKIFLSDFSLNWTNFRKF